MKKITTYLLCMCAILSLVLVACTTSPSTSDNNENLQPIEPKPCTREYRPVCGDIEGRMITFSNACEAQNAGATEFSEGACNDPSTPEGACLSFDGTWLEESQECEGMAQAQCEELGGVFNECASACRNDVDEQVCTLQCVIVCDFS